MGYRVEETNRYNMQAFQLTYYFKEIKMNWFYEFHLKKEKISVIQCMTYEKFHCWLKMSIREVRTYIRHKFCLQYNVGTFKRCQFQFNTVKRPKIYLKLIIFFRLKFLCVSLQQFSIIFHLVQIADSIHSQTQ